MQFNVAVERYTFTLLRYDIDRRVAVVEHVDIEFIRVFIVLNVKLNMFLVTFWLRYFKITHHIAEVEALSSAVRYVVSPSEVWQIRHHAVALNAQFKVGSQRHRPSSVRVSRPHADFKVAVAHSLVYYLGLLFFLVISLLLIRSGACRQNHGCRYYK